MKQKLIIFFSMFFCYLQINAQDSTKLKSFREKLLPQYILYFNRANLTEKGILELSASEKYIQLPANDKRSIMMSITAAWRESLILVRYITNTELWGWNEETGRLTCCMNGVQICFIHQ